MGSEVTFTFTSQELAELADYYHQRECHLNHNDGCGYYHENADTYPRGIKKWEHEEWQSRVPKLMQRDVDAVRRVARIIDAHIDQPQNDEKVNDLLRVSFLATIKTTINEYGGMAITDAMEHSLRTTLYLRLAFAFPQITVSTHRQSESFGDTIDVMVKAVFGDPTRTLVARGRLAGGGARSIPFTAEYES